MIIFTFLTPKNVEIGDVTCHKCHIGHTAWVCRIIF